MPQNLGRGALPNIKAHPRYVADDGEELYYFGRGFVQLTWWDNYIRTGVLLGLGVDLLLDPDSVDDPVIAYKIISMGMRTGKGFANGRTFSQFFHGDCTDYVHARSMVNGTSHQHEIGAIAQRFENVLFASRAKLAAVAQK
jgi:predicted chitinase